MLITAVITIIIIMEILMVTSNNYGNKCDKVIAVIMSDNGCDNNDDNC